MACSVGLLNPLSNRYLISCSPNRSNIYPDLSPDECYILLLRSGINQEDFTIDSTICNNHKKLFILNEKSKDFTYDRSMQCCNPFELHEIGCRGERKITVQESQQMAHLLKFIPGSKMCITCHKKMLKRVKNLPPGIPCTNPFKIHENAATGMN